MAKPWLSVLQTSSATIVSVLASAVGLVLTSRALGPEGRGLYAAVVSWVATFATVGSLSLGQVVIHHVAGRPLREWSGEVVGTVLGICGAAAVTGWVVCALLYVSTQGALFNNLPLSMLLLGFAPLPLLLWSDAGRYILNAMDGLATVNLSQILGAVLTLTGVAVLVVLARWGAHGAVGAAAIATSTVALVTLRAVLRRGGAPRFSGTLARRLLTQSARLHLSTVGNLLFAQTSVLVLNYYRPPAETGFYQLAMQLFNLALVLSTAISTVSFGLVSRKGADAAWPEQRQLLVVSLALVSAVAAVAYVLAPWGIRLMAGERFMPAVPLLRWMLPALPGATLATVMASQWIGRGLFWQAAAITIASGLLSIGLDLALVPRYGMYGALVSTLVIYGMSVVSNLAMAVWVHRRWRAWHASQIGAPAVGVA